MFSPSLGWLDQQANVFLFSSSRFSKLEDDERRSKKRVVFLFGVFVVLRATAFWVTTTEMRFGDVLARIVFVSLL